MTVFTGTLKSAPLSFAAIKYSKGSVFIWLSDESGSLDALTAAMPGGTISQLIPDESESGNALGRRLSKALGKPIYLATSGAVAGFPGIENELLELLAI